MEDEMDSHVVFMRQRHSDFVSGVEQIGPKEAARQLYREYDGRMEHGLLTDLEAIQCLLRIQLLADGIY